MEPATNQHTPPLGRAGASLLLLHDDQGFGVECARCGDRIASTPLWMADAWANAHRCGAPHAVDDAAP